MSKSELLYVKGMNMSESDEDDNEGAEWDDTKLTAAYDKALMIANAEVAKRVAMSTNTHGGVKEEGSKNKKVKPVSRPDSSNSAVEWKPGMPCRSVYSGDGEEYEAFVLRLLSDKDCIVKYLGYDNSEVVLLESLRPSLGNEERTRQIEQALLEKNDDGFGSQSPTPDMGVSDRVPSPESIDRTAYQKKKRQSKKKKANNRPSNFELPPIPAMPNISMLRNLGPMEMPMAPPPMMFPSNDRTDSEDQAISSMLFSWYMSGYYTGIYQGMKRAKEANNRKNV
ncbi:survival motor neuron [Anticarsia gemmatalis]|uniref:survival motor neuron n=1 Tax=Anticarsia gemmatalis TaxID=129554 RepID=UPI003F76CE62